VSFQNPFLIERLHASFNWTLEDFLCRLLMIFAL
jgi:hypothetical protein